MRRFSFKGWLAKELRYLSGEDTLNLRRLAYLAQGPQPRLRERLVLYAVANGMAERLRGYLYDERLIAELDVVDAELGRRNISNPDCLKGAELSSIPSRYSKAISSFMSAYYSIESRNESKRLRWQKTVQLQKRKGISNAKIYQALGYNPGNINAYLKHGDIARVTLGTATEIMEYVMTL